MPKRSVYRFEESLSDAFTGFAEVEVHGGSDVFPGQDMALDPAGLQPAWALIRSLREAIQSS